MSKQFSIAALQQQLEQLETLRDDQLNGLLNQLKSYKSKLPVEDHPIIDWGINVIKAKMQEKERLMEEVMRELERKYGSYESFKAELGNKNYNLKQKEGRDNLDKSFLECLDNLFDESCGVEHIGVLDIFVPIVGDHLQKFCNEQGMQSVADEMISRFSTFYQRRAEESRKNFSESNDEWDQKYSEHYQAIARNLLLRK